MRRVGGEGAGRADGGRVVEGRLELLQQGGDLLVGLLGGFGQVPGVPFGAVGEAGGEFGVGAAGKPEQREQAERLLDLTLDGLRVVR
ncbi:hypothetical protein [Microtetraspora malaysiensis]|uniref:Uncharacterized protein n=1 Tax=Microtetraspora malaysiensis TaxID=161358 RepID=A0ABW6T3Z3_9ACTN